MTPTRQSPRKIAEKLLCFQMEPDNHAIVLNVSDEGLGFHAINPVMESGTIHFSFTEKGQRIEASGELVWTDPTKKTGGLRFSSLPLANRERIRNWVVQAAAPESPSTASAAPETPAAPEPPPAQPKQPLPLEISAPQLNPAAIPYLPPPNAPFPPPAAVPRFALPGEDSPYAPYAQKQEPSHSRAALLGGFLAGVFVSAILVAAFFLFSGDSMNEWLATWRSRIGANAAPQSEPMPAPSVAAPIPPPLVSSGAPASNAVEPATASAPLAGESKVRNAPATPQPTPEPPLASPPRDRISALPDSAPVEAADTGDTDLNLAERYLGGAKGPSGSRAAVPLLWAAVEKGNVTAEITLADLYARGDGVTRSCEQARVLLNAAAGKSSSDASEELAQMIRNDCR